MFRAIGVGHTRSLASAAALNWVLKDGLGRLSRCIYTASIASAFDTNLKVCFCTLVSSEQGILFQGLPCKCSILCHYSYISLSNEKPILCFSFQESQVLDRCSVQFKHCSWVADTGVSSVLLASCINCEHCEANKSWMLLINCCKDSQSSPLFLHYIFEILL